MVDFKIRHRVFKLPKIMGKNGKKSVFGYISGKTAAGNKLEKSTYLREKREKSSDYSKEFKSQNITNYYKK